MFEWLLTIIHFIYYVSIFNPYQLSSDSRDRIVVSTSRCGRDNPGSNPGHGRSCECRRHGTAGHFFFIFFEMLKGRVAFRRVLRWVG